MDGKAIVSTKDWQFTHPQLYERGEQVDARHPLRLWIVAYKSGVVSGLDKQRLPNDGLPHHLALAPWRRRAAKYLLR